MRDWEKSGGPAFPVPGFTDSSGIPAYPDSGMELRDYFAAKAMQALMSSCASDGEWTGNYPETVPDHAYKMADAMLKARSN